MTLKDLSECLDLFLFGTIFVIGVIDVRKDCGLSKAHQDADEYVMKLASKELLIGRVIITYTIHIHPLIS